VDEDFPVPLAGFGPGSLVAGYRLDAQVGAGGMAVVFRARDERLGRLVALKILATGLRSDEAFRRRFIAESRAAAAVDDPHIIPVYEAGEADGVLFIAMRFVQGGDLRQVLEREGALPPDRAAAFISPVASALDAAHAAGLVHRDVKPANILVDARHGRPDHVYLSDFGVSKGALSSVSLTGTGQFLGTPGYSAPEQIQGLVVDGRADQYALACVAYQLLTGTLPFERDQGMAVLFAHLSQPPPSLGAGLPEAADRVLARALAKVPEKRYGSCQDFADALRDALGLTSYASPGWASLSHGSRPHITKSLSAFSGTGPAAAQARRGAAVPADPATDVTIDSVPSSEPHVPSSAVVTTGSGYPGAEDGIPGDAATAANALAVDRARGTRGRRPPGWRSHRSRPGRRWPIVVTALAVLVAVVVGGLVIFWRFSQDQYYVAANSKGEVVIYRGISQGLPIPGFRWSSPYELTGIQLSQVPSNFQQTVKSADSTGSLTQVRGTVANIGVAVDNCRNAYVALRNWAIAEDKYQAAVAQANHQHKSTKAIPKPGAQPPGAGPMCPSSRAFGIPASALAPVAAGSG
jgi:serine/threonine protein kinase